MRLAAVLVVGGIVAAATVSCATDAGEFRIVDGQIVTDVFDVSAALNDDGTLTVELDTDLGDTTHIMVSVSRSYIETGDDNEYPIDYFSEPGMVGEWREPRTIAFSDAEWAERLEEQQASMASLGLGFAVERILDEIDVRIEVPNQQDPPFETDNLNLTGSAVYGDSVRNVRDDVVVPLSFDPEAR